MTLEEQLEELKKENKKLKEDIDELWDRINKASASIAGTLMSPLAEAGVTFDGKKDIIEPAGMPGHQRREQRRKTTREEKDRREKQ